VKKEKESVIKPYLGKKKLAALKEEVDL